MRLINLLALCALLLHHHHVQADIPVHCMWSEAVGVWDVKSTHAIVGADQRYQPCGHATPDDPNLSILRNDSFDNPSFPPGATVDHHELRLKKSNEAQWCRSPRTKDAFCVHGRWSIVYDEGVLVNIGENLQVLFFFKYTYEGSAEALKKEKHMNLRDYRSFCSESITGWWSIAAKGKGSQSAGCVVARKRNPLPPHSSEMRHGSYFREDQPIVAPEAKSKSAVTLTTEGEEEKQDRQRQQVDEYLGKKFMLDESLLEWINAANLGWTAHAKAATVFQGRTMAEVLKMSGAGKRSYPFVGAVLREKSLSLAEYFKHPKTLEREVTRRACIERSLPKEFSWADAESYGFKDITTPVINQGSCGSCYAVAATDVATMCYRIANYRRSPLERTVIFDYKDVLDCSYVTQGCKGGYSYLVGWYGKHQGFAAESKKHPGEAQTCPDGNSSGKRYHLDDYGYVGGGYGMSNVADMMSSVYQYGPIAVAMDVSHYMFLYHKGIFRPPKKPKDTLVNGMSFWQKTTHALVLLGWGEENGKKFWLIKNSWGSKWGEGGYLRLPRGSDTEAVESMAVYFRFTKEPPNPIDLSHCENPQYASSK